MISSFGLNGHPQKRNYDLDWATRVAPLYGPLVPEEGARLYTITGPAKTFAKILLAPGEGLDRGMRRRAEAHPLVTCDVRGDRGISLPAPSPEEFHGVTLRWALRKAEYIAVWSAPFPQLADEYAREALAVANAGARFMTLIETTPDRAAEWLAVVKQWKRRSSRTALFGPCDVDPVVDQYKRLLELLD
jgi:hypothetical protein